MRNFCSFSEAIREGAKLRPQGYGPWAHQVIGETSCAIVAGYEAIFGAVPPAADYEPIRLAFLYLERTVRCPACAVTGGVYQRPLMDCLWHLNDFHCWTREAIADWLETEEEKLGFVTLTEGERSKSSVHSLQTVVV